jgi:hypothetical protein
MKHYLEEKIRELEEENKRLRELVKEEVKLCTVCQEPTGTKSNKCYFHRNF